MNSGDDPASDPDDPVDEDLTGADHTGADHTGVAAAGSPAPGPLRRSRRRRVPHFLRPPEPHDWRWVVGGVGKALITLGLLMFAFVGYQLWGTGIQTAQAQNRLDDQWQQLLNATTVPAVTTTAAPTTTDPTATTVPATSTTSTVPVAPAGPPLANGALVGKLRIPDIGLDWKVVEGVRMQDLKDGPGHFRESPMPGQLGNAAIAGHRTTYGAPFGDLDRLQPGDLIYFDIFVAGQLTTYVYAVADTVIVLPSEYAEVIPTRDPTVATLALATCHPKWTSEKRLVVRATLVPELSGQVMAPPTVTQPPETDTLPAEDPAATTTVPTSTIAQPTVTTIAPDDPAVNPAEPADDLSEDAFSGGWFDDTAAIPHAIAWGLALLAVGVGAYYAGKAAKRLYVCFLVGFVPFLIVLYFFFENVNRLLPPGL
ncbi:MAG: sortase [Actinomycetota bacterium]|nr:sortase [Actinomycetota bacterium]